MKRIEYSKFGGPEVLKVKEFSIKDPKPDEIQIKIHFAGVNFSDVMIRMGLYLGGPKPPSSLGSEASGIIIKVGNKVKNFNIGDKIMGFAPQNSYASHANINQKMAIKLPENFSMEQGAAFPLVYITAYMMMFDLGNLKKGEYFFIQGAGGGVGTAAIQLGKSIDAKIIGTASQWKHAELKKMGLDYCIDYNIENVREKIMEYTNNYGADLIIDPVGAKEWGESYKTLAPMGKLIIYGNQNLVKGYTKSFIAMLKEYFTMPKIKPFHMMASNKSIMGYHLGRLEGAQHKVQQAIKQLNNIVSKGYINPIISKVFPYEEAHKAHQFMQNRKNLGKILIDFSMIK